jgi:hypothetical protein
LTERDFTAAVLEAAKLLGWRTAHFRAGRTAYGWTTPVQGDAKGFPDLILLREQELMVRELKAGSGLTTEQDDWLRAFSDASVDASVWTPADWGEIERSLR